MKDSLFIKEFRNLIRFLCLKFKIFKRKFVTMKTKSKILNYKKDNLNAMKTLKNYQWEVAVESEYQPKRH